MADELTKALLLEEVVSPSAVAEALFASVTGGVPLVQALVDARATTPEVLASYLARSAAPFIRHVAPLAELVDRLPPGLCARLFAVPVRRDAITGTVDVAVADANDPHPAVEIGFHLGAPVRVVRASAGAIDEALRRIRIRSLPPPPPRAGSNPPPTIVDEPVRHASQPAPSRRNTLPPPYFSRPPLSAPAAPRRSVPAAAAPRRDTPPWGTPVHAALVLAEGSETPPRSGSSSEIPIPLTRRTFAVERGGTQRPPPIVDPHETALGEGMPVDPEALRAVVEIRSAHDGDGRAARDSRPVGSFIPAPPRVPSAGPFAAYAQNVSRGHPTHVGDVGGILAAFRAASSRDEILELVLTGARMLAARVALFVVKRGGYLGWSCTPEFGDRGALQHVLVPLDAQSVFDIAVQEGLYLGPIRHDDVHIGLLQVMRGATRDVAVVPIRVGGKAAVVLLADELADTMIGTRRLEEVARSAGEAFGRILRTKR